MANPDQIWVDDEGYTLYPHGVEYTRTDLVDAKLKEKDARIEQLEGALRIAADRGYSHHFIVKTAQKALAGDLPFNVTVSSNLPDGTAVLVQDGEVKAVFSEEVKP